jgi:group I intron endonuclease
MSAGIYMIKNKITGDCYVGKTEDLKSRWLTHKSALNRNIHANKVLQSDWNEYGKENFEYIILEKCIWHEIDNKENEHVTKHRPKYNIIKPLKRTNFIKAKNQYGRELILDLTSEEFKQFCKDERLSETIQLKLRKKNKTFNWNQWEFTTSIDQISH